MVGSGLPDAEPGKRYFYQVFDVFGEPGWDETSQKVSRCIDGFVHRVGADRWPASKLAKMKLQLILAGQNRSNPSVSLSNVWRDKLPFNPLDHPCFKDLYDFLSVFDMTPLDPPAT